MWLFMGSKIMQKIMHGYSFKFLWQKKIRETQYFLSLFDCFPYGPPPTQNILWFQMRIGNLSPALTASTHGCSLHAITYYFKPKISPPLYSCDCKSWDSTKSHAPACRSSGCFSWVFLSLAHPPSFQQSTLKGFCEWEVASGTEGCDY